LNGSPEAPSYFFAAAVSKVLNLSSSLRNLSGKYTLSNLNPKTKALKLK
jgi:hypothetical protein